MKNYLKIIYELSIKEDLTQEDIFNALNFGERKVLFLNDDISNIGKRLIDNCNKKNIFLFTNEEFDTIINDLDIANSAFLIPKAIFLRKIHEEENFRKTLSDCPNFDLFTEDELKEIIIYFVENNINIYVIEKLFQRLNTDDAKEEILSKIIDNKDKYKNRFGSWLSSLVSSLQSDTLKQKLLHYVRKNYRADVIKTFKDDHKKMVYSLPLDSPSRKQVLETLEDQDLVKKLISTPFFPKTIIKSIKDESVREAYFRKLVTMITQNDRGEIVASFSTREKQLSLLSLIKNERARINLIRHSNKLTDGDIWHIAKEFHSEERINEALCFIRDERMKRELYGRLKERKQIMDAANYADDLTSFEILIDKLNFFDLKKLYESGFASEDTNHLLMILLRVNNKRWVMNKFEHLELSKNVSVDMSKFVEMYARTYKLNKEHLKQFVDEYGYGVFKYIKNENLRVAINQDEDTLKKYMSLFKRTNFIGDERGIKNGLAAFAQQEYKYHYANMVNMFSNILHAMEDKDYARAEKFIKIAITESDVSVEEIANYLNISPDLELIVKTIINKLEEKDNAEILNYLHSIADKATENHRNKTTKIIAENNFNSHIPTIISEKSIMDYFVYGCSDKELSDCFNHYYLLFADEEKELMKSKERLNAVLTFKRSPSKGPIDDKLKKDLRIFGVIIRKLCQFDNGENYLGYYIRDYFGMERKPDYDNSSKFEYILSILQQIDSNQLKNTIFNNQEVHKNLLNFFQSSNLLGNAMLLAQASENANVPIDEGILANLINNFAAISDTLSKRRDKRIGLVDYLNEADYYNSESYRYEDLFGKENFKYIRNNPGPNSATMPRKERIETALTLVKKVHERKYLTVPPQNENYRVSNGVTLNVRLGDINNLMNLTLGERTGACMRIGGAGESLFRFCLFNPNGFHLTIHDPENGKLISRVSGFRNGNTVFFNQLRYSLDRNVESKHLVECIYEASKRIIEDSKKSEFPIDNVVISPDYAMQQEASKTLDLGVGNIKSGYKSFYSDVSECAIILATTAKEKEFAPVKLGSSVPKYESLKSEPSYYEGMPAYRMVNHMKTLKEYLAGKSLDKIEIKKEDISFCYATNDWIIYANSKGELKTLTVGNTKNSYEEMKVLLEHVRMSMEDKNVKSGQGKNI